MIHKANGGLSSVRSAGINVANWGFIYFVGSNDYIEEDLVAITVCV